MIIGRPKVKERRIQRILLRATPQEFKLITKQVRTLAILLQRIKGIHTAEYMRYMALFISKEYLFQEKIHSTQARIPKCNIATTIDEYEKIKQKAQENNLSINEYIIRAALSDFTKVEWDFIKKRK